MTKLIVMPGGLEMGKKRITAQDVADYLIYFGYETGELLTNLKLQKLVYYTQAWHLAIFNKPLFSGTFEAWVHGPVLPSLYNEYKSFRWRPIIKDEFDESKKIEVEAIFGKKTAFLENVIEEYFGLSGYELEKMTHSEDPWIKARCGLPDDVPCNNSIRNEWMQEYYSKYLTE